MTKEEILQDTRAFLLDLDGTVYLDDTPIAGAKETLQALRERGKRLVYLTNNSSKTEKEYREKLQRIGLWGEGDLVYTSGMAAVRFLKEKFADKTVYLLGTDALKAEFLREGILLTEEEPDICMLAYDTSLTFEKMRKFDAFLKGGARYFATHPDDVCPTKGYSMPDVGSFIALFQTSSGRVPELIIGKPYQTMGDCISAALGIEREALCMIGDRMHTDIRFANNNGMKSILVLSGETTLETMTNFPDRPDLVLPSIKGLL